MSIDTLSVKEFIATSNGSKTNEDWIEYVAAASLSRPAESKFLHDRLGYSPAMFAKLVRTSFLPMLQVLPKAYCVDLSVGLMDYLRGPAGGFSAVLHLNLFIMSGLARRKALARSSGYDHSYPDFLNYIDGLFYEDTICLRPAGRLGFDITSERIAEQVTPMLVSTFTCFRSFADLRCFLTPNDQKVVLPAPLRWADGNKTGLSDVARGVQEDILAQTARHLGANRGVLLTTLPTNHGYKMLKRQGFDFRSDPRIKEDPDDFIKAVQATEMYGIVNHGVGYGECIPMKLVQSY